MDKDSVNQARQAAKTVHTMPTGHEKSDFQYKKNKTVYHIMLLLVIVIALIAGIGIYNTPANRLQRQLDLGNRYLEEQDYEQAALVFEQVIAIDDRCMEAYVGGIKAYQNMDDIEYLQVFYDKARDASRKLDTDSIAENMYYLVQIYLMTLDVYGENLEYAVECLMEGYHLTAGNEKVREQLVKTYLKWIDELIRVENYEKAISELTEGYEETQDERLAEKLKEVQEKYNQYLEWKAYMKLVDDILIRIASFCQKENYQEVFALMQSAEYMKLLERVDEIKETVGLKTEYGNIGLYKVDSEVFGYYMIYYGDYKDSIREGQGVWLGYYNNNNYMARGNWSDDLPQGEFTVREWSGVLAEQVVYRVISGNVDKGLWNGDVLWEFEETDGNTLSFPVSFDNGKWVVLSYEEDGDAIVSDGKDGDMLVSSEEEDNILGIVGFALNY